MLLDAAINHVESNRRFALDIFGKIATIETMVRDEPS